MNDTANSNEKLQTNCPGIFSRNLKERARILQAVLKEKERDQADLRKLTLQK